MVFRLIRHRIRADWLALLIALGLMLLYAWFCGSSIRDGTNLDSYSQFEYSLMANLSSYNELSGVRKSAADPWLIARSYGIDPRELPDNADLSDVYSAVVRARGDYLQSLILMDGVLFGFPILDGIAMLLLCPLFRKRRLGQLLSAGYSRRQVWLSFTLVYFACAAGMWLLASLFQLPRFQLPLGAAQAALLAYLLFAAAIPYLAAMFLPRPAAAFFVSLAAWVLLLLAARGLKGAPTLAALIAALVAAALSAGVVLSWAHFRKRGFRA